MIDLKELSSQMESLVVLRNMLKDKTIKKLKEILILENKSKKEFISNYANFVYILFQTDENLTEYILKQILTDENFYILKKSKNESINESVEHCLVNELKVLQKLAGIKSDDILSNFPYDNFLPKWTNSDIDFVNEYKKHVNSISTKGYGVFVNHLMYTFENNILTPVQYPDPVKLSDLSGYERQREQVVNNTLALLEGNLASNILLYGDAGTGKSSTVKAVVNEYGHCGLRLVEVRKTQMLKLPPVIEKLNHNPLKFIIFIDDLSFGESNEEIGALKAILEGSVTAKAPNIVIYATSNRRHLVRKTFSERGDDEINRSETIQEQTSLSERFGLAVSFFRPNKDEYLDIVFDLAKQYKLKNMDNLEFLAERYALERGGRSGRCARQLIEYLKSIEGI